MPKHIRIQHERRDGYHVFTSPDVFGLFIATRDLDRAKLQLATSIEELLRQNEGVSAKVELPDELLAFTEPAHETTIELRAA